MSLLKIFIIGYGDPILDFVYTSLLQLGHETKQVDGRKIAVSFLKAEVEAFAPDLILINNLDLFSWHEQGREIEDYLTSGRWPITTWYFEAPHMAGGLDLLKRWRDGPYPKNILFLETDRGALDFYRERGIACGHLPLGVDAAIETLPEPKVSGFDYDLSFSGSSIVELSLKLQPGRRNLALIHVNAYLVKIKINCVRLRPDLEPQINAELRKLSDIVFPFFMEDFWDQPSYRSASCHLVDQIQKAIELGGLNPTAQLMAMGALDVCYSFAQLSYCLDSFIEKGIEIFGAPSWERILGSYHKPTRRLESEELRALYRRSKISFCLTKRTFQTFVHERAFQVLAHGGFPLVDYREELPLFFKKDEIASYRSLEEAHDLADFYLRHESARREIIAKGRARVYKEHTYLHRTQTLLELSRAHYGLA
jgi:hypothetical protein